MKFNWKANWEILLVLVIIVVGIVITTIAAIRNKDKHLLPLAEETDFGQLLVGGSAGLSDTTLPPQQTLADGQLPNTNSGQAAAAAEDPGGDVSTKRPATLQQQQSKSWRPSTFQPVVRLQPQQGNNQRASNKHQQDGRQSKYDDNLSNEFTRVVDQLLQQQQQQDSYDAMSSTEPTPTQGLQFEPNQHDLHNLLRGRDQRHYDGRHQNSNKTGPGTGTISLTSTAELDGGGPAHSPYGERLGGESADLNDDIHTTRSALALANSSAGHFMANSNIVQVPSSQLDQLSALVNLHGPYGQQQQQQQQQQAASLNQLGRLIMQNAAHSKLEPAPANSGSIVLDADDMMTSYTRMPTTTNDTILLRDYNFALAAANQSAQSDDAALIHSFNQHAPSALPNLNRHRVFSSPAPISMFLNDLLKFVRLQPDQSSAQSPSSQQAQRSLLQQLKLISGPLLASNGEQPATLSNHDASESNQHYHRVSMLPTEVHSILARSLRTSGVLPAFPAPKDAPQVWIPPTSGGNPAQHESRNMDADFVASNAAGFVRSVGISNPNEHGSFGQQAPEQHESFMRPSAGSNEQASYPQQQSLMNADNQPRAHHHRQFQQAPAEASQRYHQPPQPMSSYGKMEQPPVEQQPLMMQHQQQQQQPLQRQAQQHQLRSTPIYPSPRAVHPVGDSMGAQERNWALEQSGAGGAYGNSAPAQSSARPSGAMSEPQLEGTRRAYKPSSSLMTLSSKGSQQNHQQPDYNNNYNYKKFTQSHSQVAPESPGQSRQQFALMPTSSISGEQSSQGEHNSNKAHGKQQTHKYAQEQSRTSEVLVALGYNPAPQSSQMSTLIGQPPIVVQNGLQQQQQSRVSFEPRESKIGVTSVAAPPTVASAPTSNGLAAAAIARSSQAQQLSQVMQPMQRRQMNSDSTSLSRRKRSSMPANSREQGERVDEAMSGKYGDSNESEEEKEEDGDSRPISVVRPDGRPTDNGRVRGNQEADDDRQTAQSQRSANHLHVKQQPPPHYMSMLLHGQQSDEPALEDTRYESLPNKDLTNSSYNRAQKAGTSSHRRPVGRKSSSWLNSAESGLMSRLLGTASTTEEFEDDPDEVDDDSASEKRKEELEDAEFGLADAQEQRRNRGGLGSRARAANSRGNSSGQSVSKLRQPSDGSGATATAAANGEVGSYSRRHQQRADIEFYGHPGEETRQLKYGILGSGNYEIVNGGVYPDVDESTAAVNSVANYVRKPGLLGKLFAANHHQAAAVGPQAALIAAGGRINGGFMRGASGSIGNDGNGDLAGYVPAAELAKDLSGPLLELIDVNGGQLLDPSLLAQLGSSGSSAQTTHTSSDEDSASSRPAYGKQRKLISAKLAESQQQRSPKRESKAKIAELQNEINTIRDDERPMKFSSSNRMPTNSEFSSATAAENSGDENANQLLQQQQSSVSGSRLSHGTNQFNSYKILPSKKVTIFSDQDLDSAPSELGPAPVR